MPAFEKQNITSKNQKGLIAITDNFGINTIT